jgi:hypothetical protein
VTKSSQLFLRLYLYACGIRGGRYSRKSARRTRVSRVLIRRELLLEIPSPSGTLAKPLVSRRDVQVPSAADDQLIAFAHRMSLQASSTLEANRSRHVGVLDSCTGSIYLCIIYTYESKVLTRRSSAVLNARECLYVMFPVIGPEVNQIKDCRVRDGNR